MADWSKEWNYCRKCLSTNNKHASEGYCKPCFVIVLEEAKPKKVPRICLTCETAFSSKWIGNRRCENCLRREREHNYLDKDSHRINVRS